MNDDFDSIFDGSNNASVEVTEPVVTDDVVETPEVVAEEEAPATADPEVDQPVETPAVVEEEDVKTGKSVPLPTFLDMRDRMKEAERLAAERQRQLDEYQRSQQSVAAIPDPLLDPRGYAEHHRAEVEAQIFNRVIALSHAQALRSNDKDVVDAAVNWAQQRAQDDPNFDRNVAAQADPIDWVIQQHKAAQKAELFQRDPDEYVRQRAAEMGLIAAPIQQPETTQVAPVATTTRAEKPRPSSLTDIPAAIGKVTTTSATASFNSIFDKR